MEYRGFHLLEHQLQEEYTSTSNTSLNQSSHYKPFTRQPWNSSNNYMFCSNNMNGYVGEEFEKQKLEEEYCWISSEGLGDELPFLQSQQYSQKPILRDNGERGRYYNFGAASSSSDSQIMVGESESGTTTTTATRGLLQLSYHSLNQHHQNSICPLSYTNNMHPQNTPSNISNQGSAVVSGVARTKTPRKYCPQGVSETNPNKKATPPSCSPLQLQVRKQKLGDRIQTLQKLVAPFGKTNTASVLTEAIGYIHFLHDQIQTLSVPYMTSSQSRPFRMDSKEEEDKQDLRSRRLCLVPISYASFIHTFN